MKNLFWLSFIIPFFFISCSSDEAAYDPYYDWQARNTEWFLSAADSARTAIAQAKSQYGNEWQEHCQWRMLKRLDHAQDYDTGRTDDSICVRIAERGTGTYSPAWNDTVRFSYRGWMMPTTYRLYNQDNLLVDSLMQEVFDQTYYGGFDAQTAAPQLTSLTSFVQGFSTALQYMVEGDDWYVYIPCRLAYGTSEHGTLPAYSTLLFRIYMAAVYPAGTGVPTWKAPAKE